MTSTPVSDPPGEEQDFNRTLDKAQISEVKKIIGEYSTLVDVDPKSSGLRVGNLQIGEDVKNLKRFVYVPEDFDFRTYGNMKELLKVLGIKPPDNVFRFATNYSVVPSKEEKTIKEWRDDFSKNKVSSLFESKSEQNLANMSSIQQNGGEGPLQRAWQTPARPKEPIPTDGNSASNTAQWSRGNRSIVTGMLVTPPNSTNELFPSKGSSEASDVGLSGEASDAGERRQKKTKINGSTKKELMSTNVITSSNQSGDGEANKENSKNGEDRQNKETARIQMFKESFLDPAKNVEDGVRIRRIEDDIRNIFSAISDFESTVFLITNPFGGNVLSDKALSALEHANDSTVESIGIFHTGRADLLDGCLTVLKKFSSSDEGINKPTPYEEEMQDKIRKEQNEQHWKMKFCSFEEEIADDGKDILLTQEARKEVSGDDKQGKKPTLTRMPIPDEVFKLNSVPYKDTPRKAIRVDCKLTPGEEKYKKDHRGITWIPGGLADKCGHRLVFTSKERMREFEKLFCDFHPTGIFACGGSYRELEIVRDAIKAGKPLFAIEGTGFVPGVVNHFFGHKTSDSSTNDEDLSRRKGNIRKLSKDLKSLTRKQSNSVRRLIGDEGLAQSDSKKYKAQYGRKLRDLVDSLDGSIYHVNERNEFHPLNRKAKGIENTTNSERTKTDESVYSHNSMSSFHGKKFSFSAETDSGSAFQPHLYRLLRRICPCIIASPTYSIRRTVYNQIFTGEDDIVENLLAEKKRDSYWEEMFFELQGPTPSPTPVPTPDSELWVPHATEKHIEEIHRDYDEDSDNKYDLCKILPRKNSSGNKDGWILVQVPRSDADTGNKISIEKGLERAERTFHLVKNFMNYPHTELKIDQLLNEADVPIIGVDYEGKIIQWNQKSKEVYGEFEQGLGLFDTLKKKLEPMDGCMPERKMKELESFLRKSLEENVFTPQTFDFNMKRHEGIGINEGVCRQHGSDICMHLSLTCIPRRDRDNHGIILGAYFLFQDNTIRTPILTIKTPMPMDEKTLDLGEVLVKSDRGAINKFNEDAFYLIRSQSDSSELQNSISKVMSTASDWESELNVKTMNKQAIEECDKLIEEARRAGVRYRFQAVFFQFAVQLLVLVTTTLTVFKIHCEGNGSSSDFCKGLSLANEFANEAVGINKGNDLMTIAIIVLPIFATAFQTFIYSFRPKRKSARLLLMEKMLVSEKYKFRARVGFYNAYESKKRGSHDEVRKKFVKECQNYFDDCIQSEFRSGTMNANCKIYERFVKPRLERCRCRISFSPIRRCFSGRVPFHPFLFCFKEKHKRWRENKLHKLLQEKETRNRDIEAQNEGGDHPFHVTEQEKRLLDDLKEAEERKAKTKREKKEAADYKNKYCVLSIDDYKKERLVPQFNKFKSHLPLVVFWRNTFQVFIILFTSLSTILAALSTDGEKIGEFAYWIPVSLSLAAFLSNMLSFFMLETRIPILNQSTFGELKKAMLDMNSDGTLKRRLPTEKERVVNWVEQSILSYYYFLVVDDLENGLEGTLNQDSTKNGEGQQKATSPKSSGEIRNNGNNNDAGDRLLREG